MATETKKAPSAEEAKAFWKEKSEKAAENLKEGAKVVSGFTQIIHRNVLQTQKELLEHHLELVEAGIKKADQAAKAASK